MGRSSQRSYGVGVCLYGLPWLMLLAGVGFHRVTASWDVVDRIGLAYGAAGVALLMLITRVILWAVFRRAYPGVLLSWALASIAIFLLFEYDWT